MFDQKYIDREKSWLAFNARVLQEAADDSVPLLDRLRFLGIFSNNLDEFFRVRFAAVRRLSLSGKTGEKILGGISAQQLVKDITEIVIKHQAESLAILREIEAKLETENIFIINESEISEEQEIFLKDFFIQTLSPELVTIILNDLAEFPLLKDNLGYLAIKLVMKKTAAVHYAIIEIPKTMNRFVVLPSKDHKKYVILIDDVIRHNLKGIFNIFDCESISAHMIKISRDAQLDIDSDLSKSMLEKISTSVKDRRIGEPVRFIYDQLIEKDTLQFFSG
jgi:polyphosphate kinase